VPTTARTAELSLDVLTQSPDGAVAFVTSKAPAGWTVTTTPAGPLPIWSGRLPMQQTVALTVSVPAGTAVGRYPVQVTVTAPGANKVTRDATIEVRPAAVCATNVDGQCAVELKGDLNHDGAATPSQPAQGDFDGQGWSFDGDLLPSAGPVMWGGVTYAAPDATGTAPNFVEARGQSLLLPEGKRARVHVVAAAHNGPVTTSVTVRYADGSTADVPITVGDWAGATPSGSTIVLDMPHRIKAGSGVDGPPVRLFGQVLAVDSARSIYSVTLPNDSRVEIYAITIV
jgi:hypothetical protein